MLQHAIGDHALLADGRTAALVDPAGNVAWLCWPRFDSQPLLMSILDTQRGGVFSLRPTDPNATVLSRRYHDGSLVLETVWAAGRSRVTVEDALLLDGEPCLARRVSCDGEPVAIDVRFAAAHGSTTRAAVTAPVEWQERDGMRTGRFTAGSVATVVALTEQALAPDASALDTVLSRWILWTPDVSRLSLSSASRDQDETSLRAALRLSACVMLGLRFREGGIVAAPTTSLPQWPGTQRTWDYRYCWVRDASLAANAMLQLGLVDEAHSMGEFLAGVLDRDVPPSMVRVDGTQPPDEQELVELAGYRGAQPVRIGNAAATQLQLDVTGEVMQLARALARHDALPATLARVCGRIADWTAQNWHLPDYGIWEIRGAPRRFTHSQMMAWAALRDAAVLADSGQITGDPGAWRRVADVIRNEVIRVDGPLQLTAS
ncbi:MAG TPA: glycoside hydrolase family 15 protein, partial [Candidatus Dormibacteraeota bacterium]|nr:glycoside hydrolase family 15 protein [Candidatus Dormibacteraeota bacterium]